MERCKECGFTVMVQIQLGTGFCRPSCAATYKRKHRDD